MRPPTAPALSEFVAASPIHRRPLLAEVAAAARLLPNGSRVLDAGAGDAPYRALFAHCEYTTADWPGSVHPGGRDADIQADLHELPIPDERFDFVLVTEVLEHVAAPQRVLEELARVLRVDGGLLLTVPFVCELHEAPHDVGRYTRFAIDSMLAAAGFDRREVRPLTGYFSTLAHMMRLGGLAMAPSGGRPRGVARAAALTLQAGSVAFAPLARRLDPLDRGRGLPIGWAASARRADPGRA